MGGSMAMHQPNYVPWLGYFHKLASCDSFVHLDTVQFPRGQSLDRKSTRLNSSHIQKSRMPSSA